MSSSHVLAGRTIGGPLTPISNCVLVKLKDKAAATESGVVLLERTLDRPTEGTVVAQGPGAKHPESGVTMPMPCNVGDKVLYGKYDGTALTYDGKDHQFIRDTDILFVYDGDKMSPDNIKMIRDQLLVEVDVEEAQTAGGLFLGPVDPDVGKKPTHGIVRAVGPGRMTPEGEVVPVTLSVGDKIKFRDFAGSEITMDFARTTIYRVMKEEDVLVKW